MSSCVCIHAWRADNFVHVFTQQTTVKYNRKTLQIQTHIQIGTLIYIQKPQCLHLYIYKYRHAHSYIHRTRNRGNIREPGKDIGVYTGYIQTHKAAHMYNTLQTHM